MSLSEALCNVCLIAALIGHPRVLTAMTETTGTAAPLSISSLRTHVAQDMSHVTLQGIVTRTGHPLFLQDRTGGIEAVLPPGSQARIGDELLITGDAKPGRYSSAFVAQSVRLLHAHAPLPPLAVTAGMAATGHYDRVLVDTEGTLRAISGDGRSLQLDTLGQGFSAQLPAGDRLPSFVRAGSLLRVRGICAMNEVRTEPLVAFQILLRSPQDIRILSGPSFWTREHVTEMVLASVLFSLLAMLGQRRLQQWRFRLVLEERTRLAYDLHDALAQSFAGVGFQLQAIRSAVQKKRSTPQIYEHVDLAIGMVAHGQQDARRAIAMLRPMALEEGDVVMQLRSQAETLTRGGAITIETSVRGVQLQVSPKLQHALLSIGHEAITNAVRHADASRITLHLVFEADITRLSIEDDGRGFEANGRRKRGFGIDGMHARAMSCGGTLIFSAGASGGTRIDAILPLQGSQSAVARLKAQFTRGDKV